MAEQNRNPLKRLIDRPPLAGLIVGAISFCVLAALAIKNGLPEPRVQDEFSYLLAADTFSHGRLTNPSPPFWEHFESPHVLLRPTYMSKYPPGQGIALAIGQLLAHEPIVGVWLSTAAAAVAIYWMLLAFTSRPMAFVGGIVAALQPQFLDWGETYWGGAVAVLGAALLLGAVARWKRSPNKTNGAVFAIALLILANSRPYEGFILSVPLLAYAMWRPKPLLPSPGTPGKDRGGDELQSVSAFSASILSDRAATARQAEGTPSLALPRSMEGGENQIRPIAAALAILILGFSAMAYYNLRITGHALRMPTVEYSDQYDVYPKFWFLPRRPTPVYRNDVLRQVHTEWERGDYDALQTASGFAVIAFKRIRRIFSMAAEARVLIIPLIAGIIWLEPWIWITLAFFTLGMFAETWFLPHYAAPIMPLTLLIIVIGWRRLGKILGTLCFIAFLASVAIRYSAPLSPDSKRIGRVELIAKESPLQTGRHVIFVKYEPDHVLDDEWVYNGADPMQSSILWVRYLGRAQDAPLLNYFHDRRIWLLTVGKESLHLDPYPPNAPCAAATTR